MTGRRRAEQPSAEFHRRRQLEGLEDRARPRYFRDAMFHAKVNVAARVLEGLYPDMRIDQAKRAALLMLASVEEEVPPRPPSIVPGGPAAAAALMANLKGKDPILYASGHGVMADHNGDPVCVCGWDPARELPPELRVTQMDALRRVNDHSAQAATRTGWD